jgi:hypothetical protein|tara:strand:+ start:1622 stop:1852 length:231 start_codon:yes stop_codon:yes gene_type:complete
MAKKLIIKKGLQHISEPLKKVMKKAKKPKIKKLKEKIYNKENRLQQDSPYISNKAYNRDSKEIAEMKKELSELIKD